MAKGEIPQQNPFNNYTLIFKRYLKCCLNVFKVLCFRFVTHGKGLTFFHIQQLCSMRLWKHTRISLETPFKWRYNNWIELKTWWQKEKLLVLSIFFFVAMFSKSRQKGSRCWKGLMYRDHCLWYICYLLQVYQPVDKPSGNIHAVLERSKTSKL